MRPAIPRHPGGFRTALLLSAAAHLAVAAAAVACVLWGNRPEPAGPGIETRIAEVRVGLEMEEASAEIRPPEARPQSERAQEPPAVAGRPPTTFAIPAAIPAVWLNAIHRARGSDQPAGDTVDPKVMQASGTAPEAGPSPLHGAMKPGETVVYLLDCSGSMGEFGKLDRARAALLRTLQVQPPGVRFQVVVYNSTARPILAAVAPSSVASVSAAAGGLASLQPAGRSNHLEALRLAAGELPDYIVWLTDGDDLPTAKLQLLLRAAGKPIPVFLATVSATGVAAPRPLR